MNLRAFTSDGVRPTPPATYTTSPRLYRLRLCHSSLKEYLELHGRVLLVLWRGVALVVEVVGRGGVDDGGLLRGLVEALAVDVDQEGQQARPEETGHTGGDQVDGGERWETEGDT